MIKDPVGGLIATPRWVSQPLPPPRAKTVRALVFKRVHRGSEMTKSKNIGRGGARRGSGPKPKPRLPLPAPETVGVDPALVDPKRVLAGICIDPNEPASARVAAAKALMRPEEPESQEQARESEISRRAIAIMQKERLN
jgi:hypothetical protein